MLLQATAQSATKPGELDAAHFQQHWSVAFWRDFRLPAELTSDGQPIGNRREISAPCVYWDACTLRLFGSLVI